MELKILLWKENVMLPLLSWALHGEAHLAHNVMMKLFDGALECWTFCNHGQFFHKHRLFKDLLFQGIYAYGTICSNCVGLPSILKNMRAFKSIE